MSVLMHNIEKDDNSLKTILIVGFSMLGLQLILFTIIISVYFKYVKPIVYVSKKLDEETINKIVDDNLLSYYLPNNNIELIQELMSSKTMSSNDFLKSFSFSTLNTVSTTIVVKKQSMCSKYKYFIQNTLFCMRYKTVDENPTELDWDHSAEHLSITINNDSDTDGETEY